MNEIGMLRVSFDGRETKIERRGLRRADLKEALAMTLAHFAWEGDPKVALPPERIKAEWVTNEGRSNEAVEIVPVS